MTLSDCYSRRSAACKIQKADQETVSHKSSRHSLSSYQT